MQSLRLCISILVSITALSGLAQAEGRIVKWVDEKGITHYGDAIPPKYADRDSSEINRQGRVIKQNKPGNVQSDAHVTDAENKLSAEQKRHDRALLAAYTTEVEFDLARDRNLQTDEAAIQGLQQGLGSAKERLATNKKTADRFTQRKKPVPADVLQDIKNNEREIAKIEGRIKEREQSMEATRQRFDKDKQRFIELKRDPNAPAPPVTTAPTPVTLAPEPTPVLAPVAPVAPAAKPVVEKTAPTPTSPAASPVATTPAKSETAAAKPTKKIKRVVMP